MEIISLNINERCICEDWELCGCGNQPPYHCMFCCKDLAPQQIQAVRDAGRLI